ncbi:MAG: DUF1002 domain-containing protein [Clostridium butyricum]|nr:DUF1002 domain-containing protein [Clostridium butyricum]
MKFKKLIATIVLSCTVLVNNISFAYADSANVVTLGANLSEEQKEKMLTYFGVNKNDVVILEVNNDDERKYLEGIATEAQIGKATYSCAYVEPTKSGSGIKVKTANLTWVTSSMIASTLATSGMNSCNVVVASLFPVSGTGGLTGVMKAFEDATGNKLDEEKKELASEELITTGDLAEEIGQDKATGVINDIKADIIKNDTKDLTQIADTINNVTNNYNITLTSAQEEQIKNLMTKISEQNYDYSTMKNTLENVSDNVSTNLEAMGEKVKNSGFFDSIKNWFKDLFSGSSDNDLGILQNTNDSILGDNTQIDATEADAITAETPKEDGFLKKISNWFRNLFSGNAAKDIDSSQNADKESIIPEDAEEETHFEDANSTESSSTENTVDSSEDANSSIENSSTYNTEIDTNLPNNTNANNN